MASAQAQIDRRCGPLRHTVIHGEAAAYCAHPHLAVAAEGTWLMVFNRAPRRAVVLHPPQDAAYQNMVMRSRDEGRTWSLPEAVPDESWTGVECAGLTPLPDGAVLLNQWRFDWVAPGAAADAVAPEDLARDWAASTEFDGLHADAQASRVQEQFPMARGGGTCWVHRAESPDASFTQSVRIDTGEYSGGYGMRDGVVLPGGRILLPLSDVPHYRSVFVVHSDDGGATWSPPALAAARPGCEFEEPAPIRLPDGRILMMLRENRSRELHRVWSSDAGQSWSAPQPTGIADYPADLLRLRDGRLALVAGRRRPPFGIALYLSDDDGESWGPPVAVRDDLPDRDLGYPSMAQRADGDVVVVYYGRAADGVTSIWSTCVPAGVLDGLD